MKGSAGTRGLLRAMLRRDRIRLPAWILVLLALQAVSAAVTLDEYPAAEDRQAAVALIASSPALLMLRGPAYGASTGALVIEDFYPLLVLFIAIMSAQTVMRHTRQNEETGRGELIGALPLRRGAPLAAALLLAALANLVLGAGLAAVLLLFGLPLPGALLAGAAAASTGTLFAAASAIACEVFPTARGASGAALAAIGLLYAVRGIGDVLGDVDPAGPGSKPHPMAWASPFAWGQATKPFVENDAAWLAIPIPVALALILVAFRLHAVRDFGRGLVPEKRGPASASRFLASPLFLALRLHRGTFLAWLAGMTLLAAAFGSVGDQVEAFGENPAFVKILQEVSRSQGDLTDLFFNFVLGLTALLTTGFAMQATLRAREEESEGRTEAILATRVHRHAWLQSHALVAAYGSLAILAAAGLSMAIAFAAASGDTSRMPHLGLQAAAYLPATLLFPALALAFLGFAPRAAAPVGWTAFGIAAFLLLFGASIGLPDAVLDLSPYKHVPMNPGDAQDYLPITVVLTTAGLLAAGAFMAFGRRDLQGA